MTVYLSTDPAVTYTPTYRPPTFGSAGVPTTGQIWPRSAVGGSDTSIAGPLALDRGTLAAIAYGFAADADTGMYSPAANEVALVTNGVARLSISSAGIVTIGGAVGIGGQLTLPAGGVATAPEYSFTGDTNTGMYQSAADILRFATGGTVRLTIDASGDVFVPGNINQQRAAGVNHVVLDRGEPKARVYRDTTLAVLDSTITDIGFNQERYDMGGLHDTVTLNSQLNPPRAGVYHVGGTVNFAAHATGVRSAILYHVNSIGTRTIIAEVLLLADGGLQTALNVSCDHYFAVGDYAVLAVYQTSGTTNTMPLSGAYSPAEFWMHYLGDIA